MWMIVCVCVYVSRDGRAGEGGVQSSTKAIKYGASIQAWPVISPERSSLSFLELLAKVHGDYISPQVSDAIADRREQINTAL